MFVKATILQQRYKIVQELAQGGMGVVYLAHDLKKDSQVALKVNRYNYERLQFAFDQEAKLMRSLYHSGLPKVIDLFVENGFQCLVMEFIPGDNLFELLEKRRRETKTTFETHIVLNWADQLLDMLDYLHTRPVPVIHRDIKPHNIKVMPNGQLVLLDFGMAKELATSVPGGTVLYSSLEQINGTGTFPRSDLYSFAITIHHLITGVEPVSSTSRLVDLLDQKPDPLFLANQINQNVPESVARWISWAAELKPESRPLSAFEMRVTLRSIISGLDLPNIQDFKEINLAISRNERAISQMFVTDGDKSSLKPVDFNKTASPDEKKFVPNPNNDELPQTSLGKTNSVTGYSEDIIYMTPRLDITEMSPDEFVQSSLNFDKLSETIDTSQQNQFSNNADTIVSEQTKRKPRQAETFQQTANHIPIIPIVSGLLVLVIVISVVGAIVFSKRESLNKFKTVDLATPIQPPVCTTTISIYATLGGKTQQVSPNYIFQDGDTFNYSVDSSCKGYIYLLAKNYAGTATLIYPNPGGNEINNLVEKNRTIALPPATQPIKAIRNATTDGSPITNLIYFVFVKERDDALVQEINNTLGYKEVNITDSEVASLFNRLAESAERTVNLTPTSDKKITFGGSFPIVFSSKFEIANK